MWSVTSHSQSIAGNRTIGGGEQRGVCVVDAQANRKHREDVEDDYAEERRPDCTRDGLVRARTLPGCERNELDASVRIERVNEGLREVSEAANKRMVIVEVCETL